MIIKQAKEIAEIKQKLLQAEESCKDTCKKSDSVAAFCSIKLSCNMNVKWVMSFGLEIVGFGAKRQNVQDLFNMQHFRAHFGVSPEVIVAMMKDLPSK